MSLAEFGTLLAARQLPKRATAITFDDGYACNARVAAPILRAHRHPATFFLTTGAIGSEREFWWDELATLLVETCVPVTGLITVGAKQFEIDFAAPLVPAEILKAWHWTSPSQHVRLQYYMDIWREMRALSHAAQRAALDSMWQACSGRPISRDNYRPLTAREVKTLEAAELVPYRASLGHSLGPKRSPRGSAAARNREQPRSLRDAVRQYHSNIFLPLRGQLANHQADRS